MNTRVSLTAVVLAIGATITPATAGDGSCGLLKDRAARRTCYAETRRSPSECSPLSGDDYRLCRLQAGGR